MNYRYHIFDKDKHGDYREVGFNVSGNTVAVSAVKKIISAFGLTEEKGISLDGYRRKHINIGHYTFTPYGKNGNTTCYIFEA